MRAIGIWNFPPDDKVLRRECSAQSLKLLTYPVSLAVFKQGYFTTVQKPAAHNKDAFDFDFCSETLSLDMKYDSHADIFSQWE